MYMDGRVKREVRKWQMHIIIKWRNLSLLEMKNCAQNKLQYVVRCTTYVPCNLASCSLVAGAPPRRHWRTMSATACTSSTFSDDERGSLSLSAPDSARAMSAPAPASAASSALAPAPEAEALSSSAASCERRSCATRSIDAFSEPPTSALSRADSSSAAHDETRDDKREQWRRHNTRITCSHADTCPPAARRETST